MAKHIPAHQLPLPPGASRRLLQLTAAVRAPVDRFLDTQAAGGIVLLVAAAVAIVWANSAWADSYAGLWHTHVEITIGDFHVAPTLHFLINDGLMTIFFLVAGFEIKREIAQGELSEFARASLPVACAVGGMLVPAAIYFALNRSGPQADGWGVPMATDIAFALGIVSLLGKRIPAALRILLLALAIIDDLGAILVIALFYTSSLDVTGFYIIGSGLAVLFLFLRLGVRPGPRFLVPLVLLWIGLLVTGVHPTLSGVIVGLATPVRPWLNRAQFMAIAEGALDEFHTKYEQNAGAHELYGPVTRIATAGREAISPVVRGEEQMHGWVAFGIMPLFAFANAGVNIGGVDLAPAASMTVLLGISLGLAVGKPLGVMVAAYLCVRLGIGKLPRGVTWSGMLVVGAAAGIGFTMSIFIADLAFAAGDPLVGVAKLAILIATGIAALVALVAGRLLCHPPSSGEGDLTGAQAETSTDY